MTTAFFVEGMPKGQPRPRAFSRGGHARVYDPGTAENWKSCVAVAAQANRIRGRFNDGPLRVELRFVMPRPKCHFKTNGQLRDAAPEFHTGKPDCDNLAKATLDALTEIGAWRDDAQVAYLLVSKAYGEQPGAFISIEELEGEEEP